MLISLPFLSDAATDTDDDAAVYSFMGNYPVSSNLEWHNGVHLVAPSDKTPVRAVADGKVIHVIPPDATPSTEKKHAQNYGSVSPNEALWTDKGAVILEHTTELGANGNTPVKFTYYSVYMHLKSVDAAIVKDKLIYRKDKLGEAGQIYDQTNHMHFEICMNEANITTLLGHAPSEHPEAGKAPTADGRTDAVFGSTYVYLPASTPVLDAQPTTHLNTRNTTSLGAEMWVQIDYAGNATLVSFDGKGPEIGRRTDADAEYNLYTEATARHNSLSAEEQANSSPSGWYELLRFGRKLGRSETDKDPLPEDAEHWRKVITPAGEKWVNLNAQGTYKFSDADFPAFLGWQCIDDDTSVADQRCDSVKLRSMLLLNIEDKDQRTKAYEKTPEGRQLLAKQLKQADMAAKMRKLICKFPSEFDRGDLDARFGHIKDEDYFKENPNNWEELKAHIKALTFTDLPQAYKDAQWHLHPVAFINVMRKCGWLSQGEFTQMIPVNVIRHQKVKNQANQIEHRYHWEQVGLNQVLLISQHLSLNRMMRKYGITTAQRMAAFWGNALQETGWFRVLEEQHANGYWYYPWHGRGYLQLTLPSNYIQYWRWQGRTVPTTLETALSNAAATARNQNSNVGLRDANFPALTQEMSRWRSAVSDPDLCNAGDSAGFYWAKTGMARYADQTHVLDRKTVQTPNDGQKAYYCSPAFWRACSPNRLCRRPKRPAPRPGSHPDRKSVV